MSCVAHGTSFLFPQWDDHNEINREPLVLCCSRDQFPTSPVRWSQWNKQKAIGPVSVTGPVSYFPGVVITMKQTMSHWSCIAHGTSFLFPRWNDHNKTNREPLVLYRSRDQFPISPVRWPQWNKQRAIGPVLLTGPVSYFPSEMTTVKQTESHWSCIAQETSFLFPRRDDHSETNREPLVLYCSWDQFPISAVRWPRWHKQRAIGPVSLTWPVSYFPSEMTTMKKQTNREPLVLYRSRDQFPISPVR